MYYMKVIKVENIDLQKRSFIIKKKKYIYRYKAFRIFKSQNISTIIRKSFFLF